MSTTVFFFGMILLPISNLQTQTTETTAYSNQQDLQTDYTTNLIPEFRLEKVGTIVEIEWQTIGNVKGCLLYTSPSPRDATLSRMPSSA